jgi:hypothetical protein
MKKLETCKTPEEIDKAFGEMGINFIEDRTRILINKCGHIVEGDTDDVEVYMQYKHAFLNKFR